MAARKKQKRTCFFICPIGSEGDPIRRRSDVVRDFLLKPALKPFGYELIRADELPEPGIITRQIIQHLREDALVVADLTGNNPNVWYELAIRHAVAKPFVQIVQVGQDIPFDTAHQRTIPFDVHDPYSIEICKDDIRGQVKAILTPGFNVETPIGQALALQALAEHDGVGKVLADMTQKLTLLAQQKVQRPSRRPSDSRLEDLLFTHFYTARSRLIPIHELLEKMQHDPQTSRLSRAELVAYLGRASLYSLNGNDVHYRGLGIEPG
jgi:hypothetical protein